LHRILVTVCARGGSKGVKGKNVRILNGKPLISYTIKQALNWDKASRVVVSTDSEEIASIGRGCGAEVPFIRPSDLATDRAGKVPVIRHTFLESERVYREKYDIIVDLDVTAPIRTIQDLDSALELFDVKSPKTLFSVVVAHKNPYFNMVEIDKQGKAHLSKRPVDPVLRRQDAPTVYSMNASIIMFARDFLLDESNLSAQSDNSIPYVMDEIASIDVDREIDLKFIEFLIKEGLAVL